MDFEEYTQRLQTFTLESFPMAHYKLTPSKMARWGLIVVDQKVQCSACFEIFEIPEEIQFHGELLRILQQIKTRHRVNCPYYDQAGFKVTRDFMHVHADSYFKECLMSAPDIKIILPELNEQMQTILTINGAISNQRALALFGWQIDQGQLLCKFCGRKLSIIEPFNIVEEHRYFCNWVNFNTTKESGYVILARQLYEQFITDEQQAPTEFVQIGAIRRQIAVQLDELHKESLEIGKFLFQIQNQNSGILDTMSKRKQFEEFKQQQQEFEERLEKKVKLNQLLEIQEQNVQVQKEPLQVEQDIQIQSENIQQEQQIPTICQNEPEQQLLDEDHKAQVQTHVEALMKADPLIENQQQEIQPTLENQQDIGAATQEKQIDNQEMEIEKSEVQLIEDNANIQVEKKVEEQTLDNSNQKQINYEQMIEINLEEHPKISQEQFSPDIQNFAPSQQEEGYINSFQQFSMQSPEQQQLLQNILSEDNQDQSDKIQLVYLERPDNENENYLESNISKQNEIEQFQGDSIEKNEQVELQSPQVQQEQVIDNQVSSRGSGQQIIQEEQIEQANDNILQNEYAGVDISDNSLNNESLTGQAQNEQTIDQLSQEDGQEQEQDQQDQTIKQ